MSEETTASPSTTEQNQPENGSTGFTRQKKAALILGIILVLVIVFGLRWFIQSRTRIMTDNAFIEASIYPVAPRINGTITNILVHDNQFVRKGELLVELDATDYQVSVDKAEAELGIAQNETTGNQLQVAAARATVQSARAQHQQAVQDITRGKALFEKEVIPKEQLERLQTALQVAEARLKQSEEALKKDEVVAGIGRQSATKAQIRRQQALLSESKLKLGYTRIAAPVDGYITRKGVEVGTTIQAGQFMMAVVPLVHTWVVANYKESQLAHIKPGQKVTLDVDAYPNHTFKGTVDSIMAGTGAAFSLLPPENATGNYVKVVQRVPVKIIIDQSSDPKHLLRIGMSVEPTITTGRSASDVLKELF